MKIKLNLYRFMLMIYVLKNFIYYEYNNFEF